MDIPINNMGVVEQVRRAIHRQNRFATACGFILGGFVPIATFTLAHYEVAKDESLFQIPVILVLGGLLYSAKTVYDWAKLAFYHIAKALGFVLLVEGVMTFSVTSWLAFSALALLVLINGIATGCILALAEKRERVKRPKRERMESPAPALGPPDTKPAAKKKSEKLVAFT